MVSGLSGAAALLSAANLIAWPDPVRDELRLPPPWRRAERTRLSVAVPVRADDSPPEERLAAEPPQRTAELEIH